MAQILIQSILGGQSPMTHMSRPDQFRASLGIDPSLGLSDSLAGALPASGLLRPVGYAPIYSGFTGLPMWMKDAPKTTGTFVYDINGSAHVIKNDLTFGGSLSDGGSLSNAAGNGAEYYDNYLYFAKNTDIARFGPLDGDAVFDGSYWVTTLGKGALSNTAYPISTFGAAAYPNHILHRHSDGKLYIGDVVSNQGAIHYISTKKTTKEGDTDNGSTASKLLFGYGLWPTAIESYGSNLVIALFEGHVDGVGVTTKAMSSKLAFWDTQSQNFNSMIFVEFPDEFITALKNIDGVLYIFSGNHFGRGFRVSRYVGGYTVEEVAYFEQGAAPRPGAVDGDSRRLLFGSNSLFPDAVAQRGSVYSLGLQKSAVSRGLFLTGTVATSATVDSVVGAIINNATSLQFSAPLIGWSANVNSQGQVDSIATDYSQSPQLWQSQVYKIGQPFSIRRIRIPLATQLTTNMVVTPTIYFDDGRTSYTLPTINSTNFDPTKAETGFGSVANIKIPADAGVGMGQHNFYLDLRWTGSALCVVGLPILVEFDVTPD